MRPLRIAAVLVAACALVGPAHADDLNVYIKDDVQIGSWSLSEPVFFIGEHERFILSPGKLLDDGSWVLVVPFGIGCSLGQYTLTFGLWGWDQEAAPEAGDLVVTVDGSQRMTLRANRGTTKGTDGAIFAQLSSADLAVLAAAKTIDVHLSGKTTAFYPKEWRSRIVGWHAEGTAKALKALATFCAPDTAN
jgi:hypothetical protein